MLITTRAPKRIPTLLASSRLARAPTMSWWPFLRNSSTASPPASPARTAPSEASKRELQPFDAGYRATLKQSPDPAWNWKEGIRDEAPNGKEWKAEAELGWKSWETGSVDKRCVDGV